MLYCWGWMLAGARKGRRTWSWKKRRGERAKRKGGWLLRMIDSPERESLSLSRAIASTHIYTRTRGPFSRPPLIARRSSSHDAYKYTHTLVALLFPFKLRRVCARKNCARVYISSFVKSKPTEILFTLQITQFPQ